FNTTRSCARQWKASLKPLDSNWRRSSCRTCCLHRDRQSRRKVDLPKARDPLQKVEHRTESIQEPPTRTFAARIGLRQLLPVAGIARVATIRTVETAAERPRAAISGNTVRNKPGSNLWMTGVPTSDSCHFGRLLIDSLAPAARAATLAA